MPELNLLCQREKRFGGEAAGPYKDGSLYKMADETTNMIARIQAMLKRQSCTQGDGGTPGQAGNVLVDILVCLAFIGLLFMMMIAAV